MLSIAYDLLKSGLKLFGERQKASHEIKVERMKAGITMMQSSWADEFLIIIWSSPLVVGWFFPERAAVWFSVFNKAPEWYQVGWIAITGAVFAVPKLIDFAFRRRKSKN